MNPGKIVAALRKKKVVTIQQKPLNPCQMVLACKFSTVFSPRLFLPWQGSFFERQMLSCALLSHSRRPDLDLCISPHKAIPISEVLI